MYEYTSIYTESHSAFNKKLSEHSKEGWEPIGSIAITYTYNQHSTNFERFSILLKRKVKFNSTES